MSSVSVSGFDSSKVFEELHVALQDEGTRKKVIGAVKAVIVLTLTNNDGKKLLWVMDFKKDGKIAKVEGTLPKRDVQLLLKDADFVKLAAGTASGQKLFMSGGLKVKGNMMKATAIESVFKSIKPKAKL